MSLSIPIEIGGAVLGAAIRQERGYRFIATNLRAADMDQSVWPTLDTLHKAAEQLLQTGRIDDFTPDPVEE